MIIFHMFCSVRGVKRQLHWNSSFCSILFDWFENRTDSKIGVRFCSIAEPNQTIGVRLGSIGFLFGFIRLDRSGLCSHIVLSRAMTVNPRGRKLAGQRLTAVKFKMADAVCWKIFCQLLFWIVRIKKLFLWLKKMMNLFNDPVVL